MRDSRQLVAPAIVIVACVVSAVAFLHLPRSVAVHWGLDGAANGFGSPLFVALFIPVGMTLIFLCTKWFGSGKGGERSWPAQIRDVSLGNLLALHVVIVAGASGIIPPGTQQTYLALVVSLGMIVLGNYLPRIAKPNLFIGIRSPWAFANTDVWRRTQRMGGYGYVAAGVVGFLGALIMRSAPIKPLFAAILIQLCVVYVYSYRIAHSDVRARRNSA